MRYKIPLFDLNFDGSEERAAMDTIRSGWISTGPRVHEFEESFASMLGSKYAIALSNCTTALHLALIIAGIKSGDEVIVPSLSFVATVNAVKYLNAIPVFCDVKSYEDLTIDPEHVKKLITKRTKAIIPMHFAGFSANMDELTAIAEDNNFQIIEDACHGPLSEYHGKKLGTLGAIGCFSFFSNKNISTGEGGMLITSSEEIANKAKNLRSHGMTSMSYERSSGHATEYDVTNLGYNYRMDDIRASIGVEQLKKLPEDLELRRKVRAHYISRLSGIKGLMIPFEKNSEFSSNYIMPVVLDSSIKITRNQVRYILKEKGIQTSVHYPPVHRFSIYKDEPAILPVTDYLADYELTLPMFSKLNERQIDYICDVLINAIK